MHVQFMVTVCSKLKATLPLQRWHRKFAIRGQDHSYQKFDIFCYTLKPCCALSILITLSMSMRTILAPVFILMHRTYIFILYWLTLKPITCDISCRHMILTILRVEASSILLAEINYSNYTQHIRIFIHSGQFHR